LSLLFAIQIFIVIHVQSIQPTLSHILNIRYYQHLVKDAESGYAQVINPRLTSTAMRDRVIPALTYECIPNNDTAAHLEETLKRILLILLTVLTLTACNYPTTEVPSPTNTATLPPVDTSTPEPTETATPTVLEVTLPDPSTIVLDFVEEICSAEWSNNGEYLPCPGDPNATGHGYAGQLDNPIISGHINVDAPSLITIPAYEKFAGIFGHYPEFEVWEGDTFHAVLGCQVTAIPCDVDFGLSYFDANGTFHDLSSQIGPMPFADHDSLTDSYSEVEVDLSSLAGQTVGFTLVVRTHGDPKLYNPIWIAPYIQRDPNAEPPVPVVLATATTSSTSSGTPGTISGMVDLASAPPYLKDSYSGKETPVVVVFFNLDDGTWWWIHTTPTHPYYSMTVPPGNYHVVAYARGVGGLPYVTGGYTGSNPSCGNELKTVTVQSNGSTENIVIADWNEFAPCQGDAYRPEKPASIPIP
jgi:hypothetical protein